MKLEMILALDTPFSEEKTFALLKDIIDLGLAEVSRIYESAYTPEEYTFAEEVNQIKLC